MSAPDSRHCTFQVLAWRFGACAPLVCDREKQGAQVADAAVPTTCGVVTHAIAGAMVATCRSSSDAPSISPVWTVSSPSYRGALPSESLGASSDAEPWPPFDSVSRDETVSGSMAFRAACNAGWLSSSSHSDASRTRRGRPSGVRATRAFSAPVRALDWTGPRPVHDGP